jgi:hypothetical protein
LKLDPKKINKAFDGLVKGARGFDESDVPSFTVAADCNSDRRIKNESRSFDAGSFKRGLMINESKTAD